MKNCRLLFACLLLGFSCSGFAEVLIYSGFAKEMRPGSKRRATRAVLVIETDFFAQQSIAILAPGSGSNERWVSRYSPNQISDYLPGGAYDPHGTSFLLVRGKTIDEGRSETNLHLTSNYTKDAAQLSRPRTFSGRLTTIKYAVGVVFVIIDGQPPTSPQAPDLSELSLVFSLDTRRTDAARKAKQSFDDIVNPKPGALTR